MPIDANWTDGISLAGTGISTGIGVIMTPPLVYFAALGFAVICARIAWKFVKPRIGR